jgi:hypothetical protein
MKKLLLHLYLFTGSLCAFAQPAITEVLMPQYMQGTNVSGNTGRVPFACRLTITGLSPDSTYRYIPRMVLGTNSATNAGAANSILVPPTGNFIRPGSSPSNFNTPGDYGTFVASATGTYTGWFVIEPTANSTRFIPGNDLFVRIILNDGSTGTAFASYPTAPSAVRVIHFGATAPNGGTGIRSTAATLATATNFVMLYDNELGTGRPISSTFVEDDGTSGSSYAPFYLTSVNTVDKAWGTIIPDILPNGIRRIAQFSRATGELLNVNISTDGTWPGVGATVSTVNPTGGLTEIVLDGNLVTLSVKFSSFFGSVTGAGNVLQWQTQNELGTRHFVLERSSNGSIFSAIAVIEKARVTTSSAYTFTDASALAGNRYFYRIKAIGNDGKAQYSGILALGSRAVTATINVYPNPVVAQFTLQHSEAGKNAVLQLLDNAGRQLKQWPVMQGAMQSSFAVEQLAAGVYTLRFINNGEAKVVSLVKQ